LEAEHAAGGQRYGDPVMPAPVDGGPRRARRVGGLVDGVEVPEAVRVVRAAADVALLSLPDISTEGQTAEDDEEREWPAPPECMNEVRHGSFPPYFVTSIRTGGATIGGTLPAGGVPTITVSSRTCPPAVIVRNAMPCVPVATVSVATWLPTGITTEPTTLAIAGSLLLTVTGVSVVAGVGSNGTITVCRPLLGVISCPGDCGRSTVTATGGAMIGGTLPAGGVPTITVSPRTSVPAWRVSSAVPVVPVVIVSVAVCEPADTTTAPTTVATAGSVLVTVTGVSTAAGVGSSGTVSVRWPLVGVMSCPSDCGLSTV